MGVVVFVAVNLLNHFTLAHVQVAVADPLYVKPVAVTPISAALKLELEHVDGALQVAPSGDVGVLVVAHGGVQAQVQRSLQLVVHETAHERPHQDAEGKEECADDVRKHDELPAEELGRVHAVVADFAAQEVDATGGQAHAYQHVGDRVNVVGHHLLALEDLDLQEEAQAEESHAGDHRHPVQHPEHLRQLVPLGLGKGDLEDGHFLPQEWTGGVKITETALAPSDTQGWREGSKLK